MRLQQKTCGTCKYFQCDVTPTKCGSALSYNGFCPNGVCTCQSGEYYGKEIGIYDRPSFSGCYRKLILEDTATEKAVKSIAAKAILKAIFKI